MSKLRLVVREADRDWSGTVDAADADRAIAALSADPTTLAELQTACSRHAMPREGRACLEGLSPGLCDESTDAGLVVIDLAARLVADSTSEWSELSGEITYHDGDDETETWLPFHLADDWLLTNDCSGWRRLADERRREREARPMLEVRQVVYGRPLLEFIARETFETQSKSGDEEWSDESKVYDAIKQIHANWLMTPRDDLNGECPREVMLAQREHINWDLQDQSMRWTRLDECPPAISPESNAYRHGGFGTHELVKYYDLVRELLAACWGRMAELDSRLLTVGDFLSVEVPRLERDREQWFDAPDPECHGRTPRSIINRERSRIPEAVSGREAMIDEDCPCCQMMAEMPGPVFWHLDGCNMDDEFVFSIYHRTQEEWDAEQQKWAEHSRRFDAECEERKRMGIEGSEYSTPDPESVWACSVSVGDDADVPLGIRLFGIGCRLAELFCDIREDISDAGEKGAQFQIDQLNGDFGNMREILLRAESSIAEAMIQPIIDRFSDSLAALAVSRPHLSEKCASLTESLAAFLNPRPEEPDWNEYDPEIDDFDVPF